MSKLEHLVENGLVALEEGCDRDKWFERMRKDPNLVSLAGMDIEDLWTICIYVFYTYVPCVMEERGDGNDN